MLAKLPEMSLGDIFRVWKKCIKMIGQASKAEAPDAVALIRAIEVEWNRRAVNAPTSDFFYWPTVKAPVGGGQFDAADMQKDGMLAYLEYHVGRRKGEVGSIRRATLSYVFSSALPPVFPREYLSEWGKPGTSTRLRKLAECIASFIRNSKRRQDDRYNDAISEWNDDLTYLHEEYYVEHFRFEWPHART